MDKALRSQMESRLGHDFGDVRVHTDGAASDVGQGGRRPGLHGRQRDRLRLRPYDPGSTAGQKTIAHELTHVVQQKAGPVDGTPAAGGIKVSDPGDRFEQEAETTAEHARPAPDRPEEEEEMEPEQ